MRSVMKSGHWDIIAIKFYVDSSLLHTLIFLANNSL